MRITPELLAEYALDDGLDPDVRQAVEAHLSDCPEDQRLVEDYLAIDWALKQPGPLTEVLPTLPATIPSLNGHSKEHPPMSPVIQVEVLKQQPIQASPQKFRLSKRRMAVACAASMFAIVGIGKLGGLGWLAAHPQVVDHATPEDSPKAGGTPGVVAVPQAPATEGLALGHPVTTPSETVDDGNSRLRAMPENPLAPLKSFNWYFGGVPAHVTVFKFNPSTRKLLLSINFKASDTAKSLMRNRLADRYAASGRPEVKSKDIALNDIQMTGYRIILQTKDGGLELAKHEGRIEPGATAIDFEVPAEKKDLIEMLTNSPSFVRLVVTELIPFGYSVSATTEATNLRSSSLKALQSLVGGGRVPTGPVILDPKGKEEYLQQMRNELHSSTIARGLEPQAIEFALKQLGAMNSLSFAEFLARPGEYYVWNSETRKLDARPEQYDILKNETQNHETEKTQIKTLCDKATEFATHDNEEISFFNHLVEESDFGAKASGGMLGIFSAELSADLKTKKDLLNESEKKSIKDFMQKAKNRTEFASSNLRESESRFRGRDHVVGITPRGWDLYLMSDETVVGETLYGSDQVKVIDYKTVEVSQNLSLEVEAPRAVSLVDPSAHDERIKALEKKQEVLEALCLGIASTESQFKVMKDKQSDLEKAIKLLSEAKLGIASGEHELQDNQFGEFPQMGRILGPCYSYTSPLIKFNREFVETPHIILVWDDEDTYFKGETRRFIEKVAIEVSPQGFKIRASILKPMKLTGNSAIRWLAIGK